MRQKTIKFDGDKIYIKVGKYINDRIGILANSVSGEPYGNITINLPDKTILNYNEVFIDSDCKSSGLEEKLIEIGIIKDIIEEVRYNYGKYDLVIIDFEKIKEYDPVGFKKYVDKYQIPYSQYTREEMSDIAKNEGFVFVETSKGDNYIIRKSDICDFIMQESKKQLYSVDIKVYVPNNNIQTPLLTTMGCFLNKVNQNYRNEIIERLIKLQKEEIEPKEVKVFDNEIFRDMSLEELGEKEGKTLQFDKFFKKYYEEEEEMEAE